MKSLYLPSSSERTTHKLFSNFKSIKSTPFKPFPLYKMEVTSLFTKYQHKALKIKDKESIETTRNRFISPHTNYHQNYSKEKEEISRILSESKRKDHFFSYDKEPKVKIDQSSTEYEDPLDSFAVIKHNQHIYNNIKQHYQQRELQFFKKSIVDINNIKQLRKSKGNVRIRPVALKKLINFQKSPLPRMSSRNSISLSMLSVSKVKLKGMNIYPKKNFPESRQQFTLVSDSAISQYVTYIYLFGGISSNKDMNCLWRLDVHNLMWEQMKADNLQPLSRYGHTSVFYKNKIICFGGKMIHEPVFAGLDMYNIETNEWSTPILPPMNYIRLRYGHIASVIGQHMLIHGGINEFGEMVNETLLLSLGNSQIKWTKCYIDTYQCLSPFRAMHSCCLVLPDDLLLNPKLNIYNKFNDVDIDIVSKNIKEVGLYIFGGRSKDKGLEQEIFNSSNDLFVLHIFNPKPDWAKIITKGLGPSPRYLTSMVYYGLGNLIFIYGGRTDVNRSMNELNDFYALNLDKFNWIKIVISNLKLDKRCGHACFIQDDYYFIFGGMNNENYLKTSFVVLNLVEEESKFDLKQITKLNESQKSIFNINNCNSPRTKLKQFRMFNLSDIK